MVANVSHGIKVGLEQLAYSRVILHRHEQCFSSGPITRFVRFLCVRGEVVPSHHRVKLTGSILRDA
jgi:hypothetical protein